jgi:hypothetical protein
MNFLLVRLVLWFFTLAVCPIPVTIWPRSFEVEVLERITVSALPQERPLEVTERVLLHLENAEKKETDPWLRDDIRIAWITARWSQHGIPDWSLHGYASPYVAATWQVLNCHPDQVWPRILAQREAKLGKLHSQVWGVASSPRKPVQSVKLGEGRRRGQAA